MRTAGAGAIAMVETTNNRRARGTAHTPGKQLGLLQALRLWHFQVLINNLCRTSSP